MDLKAKQDRIEFYTKVWNLNEESKYIENIKNSKQYEIDSLMNKVKNIKSYVDEALKCEHCSEIEDKFNKSIKIIHEEVDVSSLGNSYEPKSVDNNWVQKKAEELKKNMSNSLAVADEEFNKFSQMTAYYEEICSSLNDRIGFLIKVRNSLMKCEELMVFSMGATNILYMKEKAEEILEELSKLDCLGATKSKKNVSVRK